MTFNNTSWNFPGDVPYIPDIEGIVDGYYRLYRFWRLNGRLRFMGEHHVRNGSAAVEDGFFTVDLGIERSLLNEHLSIYFDVRNITNTEGAWWTGQYEIPGAGMYIGLKAAY